VSGPPSQRTRVRRVPARAAYDRVVVQEIFDEALVCHVCVVDGEQPIVVPTLHARDGDRLLLHGSAASRAMRLLAAGVPAAVCATHIDGLVLARSAFFHSVNYRSAVALGAASPMDDETKLAALRLFLERYHPGRWNQVRQPSPQEFKATAVVSFPLSEASAKRRSGPPTDLAEDLGRDVWAGIIPLELRQLPPVPHRGDENASESRGR
jgi:nitroimidazol reductase NimA-like FMN-containing flavoprotein (pyridoxamine 5'-phosphate oxidase superfamily)